MMKPRALALLAGAATCAAVTGGTAHADPTPAPAAVAAPPITDETANTGGFLTVTADTTEAQIAERVAMHAAEVHALTPANGLCTGTWNHPVSAVQFQRAPGGTLAWGFWFTTQAKAALGPVATVSMPFSYVNGRSINPPYRPHTQSSGYNFHGSLRNYQFTGGGGGTIQTGNNVTFYWYAVGSRPGSAADRYITCKVPRPGSS
ncbi:hypothetical protein [Streptosporangium sp. NPDC004631]